MESSNATANLTIPKKSRVDWDEYFIKLAFIASERATCPRLSVGSIIVKEKRVVSTGYNGSPPSEPHCIDVGCLMDNNHCVRTIHSEQNAITHATRKERAGSTIYCTDLPCYDCSDAISHNGIIEVVYAREYKNAKKLDEALKLLHYHGIVVRQYSIGQ